MQIKNATIWLTHSSYGGVKKTTSGRGRVTDKTITTPDYTWNKSNLNYGKRIGRYVIQLFAYQVDGQEIVYVGKKEDAKQLESSLSDTSTFSSIFSYALTPDPIPTPEVAPSFSSGGGGDFGGGGATSSWGDTSSDTSSSSDSSCSASDSY